MKVFSRLSMAQLTLLGTGTLFISIAFLAFKDINSSRHEMNDAAIDTELVSLVSAVERVAHHHAVERGLTAGYLGKPAPESRKKVVDQRRRADEAFKSLDDMLSEQWTDNADIVNIVMPLLEKEKDKAQIRQLVDQQEGGTAFDYYSGLNARALNAASSLTLWINNRKAKQLVSQGLLLAQLKERLGQRRGKLNAVLSRGAINNVIRDDVKEYSREIKYLSEKLLLSSNDLVRTKFSAYSSSDTTKRVEEIASKVLRDNPNFDVLPTGSEWFSLATEQIGAAASILGAVFDTVAEEADKTAEHANQSLWITVVIIVIVTLFIVAIYRVLIRIITSQLSVLVSKLDKIAEQGDLTIDVSMSTSNELGDISRSVNTTILALRDLVRGLGISIATSTRLSTQLETSSSEMLTDANKTQSLTTNMASAVEQVAITSREIARASLETLHASKELDTIANKSLEANDNISNSMTLLSKDIQGVQSNAAQMEQKVTEIGTILETINTLSDQTNLLALNAAIEAARAGEHGRGFAVVADEVRTLAQSSRESSDKISQLLASLREASLVVVNDINKNVESISKAQATTVEGRATAEDVKKAAADVEIMANNMSSAAEQQSVTTEEISKELVVIDEAAKHEVFIAQKLSDLSSEMKENNLLLQRTIDGFKAD